MLEEDNTFQTANVYIDPPPTDELTDEDSGDEDAADIHNLSGRQLQSYNLSPIKGREAGKLLRPARAWEWEGQLSSTLCLKSKEKMLSTSPSITSSRL